MNVLLSTVAGAVFSSCPGYFPVFMSDAMVCFSLRLLLRPKKNGRVSEILECNQDLVALCRFIELFGCVGDQAYAHASTVRYTFTYNGLYVSRGIKILTEFAITRAVCLLENPYLPFIATLESYEYF